MLDCDSLIATRVDALVRSGALVDVYKMAELLQLDYPEMTLDALARKISKRVAKHHGNAMWDKFRSAQTSN